MGLNNEEKALIAKASQLQKREKTEKVNRPRVEAAKLLELVQSTMSIMREGMKKLQLTTGAKFTIECRQKDSGLEIIAKRITVKDRGAAIYITADDQVTDAEGRDSVL